MTDKEICPREAHETKTLPIIKRYLKAHPDIRTLAPSSFQCFLTIVFIWLLWLVLPEYSLASDLSSQGTDRLIDVLSHESLGPGMLAFALGSAFFLGAGHALSPGHGKAMVAAYLVGSRGRKRDAVFLGLVVTFTHVASVLILGVIVLILTDRILADRLATWAAVLSGMLILGVGIFMLRRALRARAGHGHSHGHAHSHSHHDHGHSHEPHAGTQTRPGLASLLSLGVAGGMVPCPSAIVVLLVSVSLQKVALGLIIILVFSLGLAMVLVAIGIAVVSASGFASGFVRFDSLMKVLPMISACLIMILGVILTGHALTGAGWIPF